MYVCNGTRITSNNICRVASGILNIFVKEEDNTCVFQQAGLYHRKWVAVRIKIKQTTVISEIIK